jgi:serine/threonine protein kinase
MKGLTCTHALRVVHRDLKPANILVMLNGKFGADDSGKGRQAREALDVVSVKIIDFGLARELSSASLLTGENVVGTPMYFAPEQTISGADISTLTDIWAVGVLIFHSITGKLPFAKLGDALQVIVHEICTKAPPDVCAASNNRASKHLRKVVEDALQKHPHRRLASAQMMLARLKHAELLSAAQHLPLPAGEAAEAENKAENKRLREQLVEKEGALQQREQQMKQQQQQQQQQQREAQQQLNALEEQLRDMTRANDDFHQTIKDQHKEALRANQARSSSKVT